MKITADDFVQMVLTCRKDRDLTFSDAMRFVLGILNLTEIDIPDRAETDQAGPVEGVRLYTTAGFTTHAYIFFDGHKTGGFFTDQSNTIRLHCIESDHSALREVTNDQRWAWAWQGACRAAILAKRDELRAAKAKRYSTIESGAGFVLKGKAL